MIEYKNYEDYKNLIYKLAHRHHPYSNIELDELIGWGNLKFVECQKDYDPMLASFSTYLYIQLTGMFLEMARKQNSGPIRINTDNGPKNNTNPEEYLLFKEILCQLPEDAKEVCNIIFETPMDLIKMVMELDQPRGVNKHQIQRYLRQQGWSFGKIWQAFKEISTSLAL